MDEQQTAHRIEELFGERQRAVEKAWERCVRSIHACDRDAIAAGFAEFASNLRRQIRLEEEFLFPALAREAKGLENDPIVLVRSEHKELEAILGRLQTMVDAHNCAALYGQHVGPSGLLRMHFSGEQNVLYPLADLLIPAAKRAEIIEHAHRAACVE